MSPRYRYGTTDDLLAHMLAQFVERAAYYLATMSFSQRASRYGPAARSHPGPSGVCEQASAPSALLRHWNQGAGLARAPAQTVAMRKPLTKVESFM